MANDCAFCRIVAGDTASYQIFEDEATLAFLDSRPLFPGHALLVPKQHVETLPDLPSGLLAPLFGNVQTLCRAVERAFDAEGTFVAVNNRVSQSVPHLHVHIVPRRRKDGLKGFFWPRSPYKDEGAARAAQQAVRAAIAELQKAPG